MPKQPNPLQHQAQNNWATCGGRRIETFELTKRQLIAYSVMGHAFRHRGPTFRLSGIYQLRHADGLCRLNCKVGTDALAFNSRCTYLIMQCWSSPWAPRNLRGTGKTQLISLRWKVFYIAEYSVPFSILFIRVHLTASVMPCAWHHAMIINGQTTRKLLAQPAIKIQSAVSSLLSSSYLAWILVHMPAWVCEMLIILWCASKCWSERQTSVTVDPILWSYTGGIDQEGWGLPLVWLGITLLCFHQRLLSILHVLCTCWSDPYEIPRTLPTSGIFFEKIHCFMVYLWGFRVWVILRQLQQFILQASEANPSTIWEVKSPIALPEVAGAQAPTYFYPPLYFLVPKPTKPV